MIPTTDEMDHTTPEERNKLAAMCGNCGTWKHFTRQKVIDHDTQRVDERPTAGQTCDNCGGHDFLTSSIISQRTWNAERAKKETAKHLRKLKK